MKKTLLLVAVAALAGLAFRHAFFAARVLSTSMVPGIVPGDRLWVSAIGRATPRRGEVIVFRHRGDGESGALVKRVIGLPGDRIAMRDSVPIIDGREVPSCDAGTFIYFAATKSSRGRLMVEELDGRAWLSVHAPGPHDFAEYVVKPGEVFVLGDNRGVSNDSRSWPSAGVALGDIEGKVEHVLWGEDRAGAIDLGRVWRRLGTGLRIGGVDVAPLREGIERCLQRLRDGKENTPRQPFSLSSAIGMG
jgi:signal peptidase I